MRFYKNVLNKKYKNYILLCAFLIALIIFHQSGLFDFFSLDYVQSNALQFRQFVHDYYAISVFIFLVVFIAAGLFFVPITSMLTLLGGYLFGVVPGFLYSMVAALIVSVIIFLVTRYTFRSRVQKYFKNKFDGRFEHVSERVKKDGYSYLLTLHFLPVTPVQLISVVAALSSLSFFTFLWVTIIGLFPGTLLYTLAGQHLTTITSFNDIISWQMLFIFVGLAFLAFGMPYFLRFIGCVRS